MFSAVVDAGEANPMPLGVDDAGAPAPFYDDLPAQTAFDAIDFDFLVYHIHGAPRLDDLTSLTTLAEAKRFDFILNQENSPPPPGDPLIYNRPGRFFQPPADFMTIAGQSPRFRGIIYDEAEHWLTNGIPAYTSGEIGFIPHFHDAEGETLNQAYEGNLENLQTLMVRHYAGYETNARAAAAGPVEGPVIAVEYVFPILTHLFARAGIAPSMKYLKETISPVGAALALGAAKQYGLPYWACLDLWWILDYPGHSSEQLDSALKLAYWTGADRAYIENFNYREAFYRAVPPAGGDIELLPWGEVARAFRQDYMPAHPRPFAAREFSPTIVIVRFPDSDWAAPPRPWARDALYGATNLVPDTQTRYWNKVWNVISHGTIPETALNYNAMPGLPWQAFFPSNNVAVYDHLAAEPTLYESVQLVFLAGKEISPECMATITGLVRDAGMTVVTPAWLAPPGMVGPVGEAGYAEYADGAGCWLVSDDVMGEGLRARLAPFLGDPGQMRFAFGHYEVIFTEPPTAPGTLAVEVRTQTSTSAWTLYE